MGRQRGNDWLLEQGLGRKQQLTFTLPSYVARVPLGVAMRVLSKKGPGLQLLGSQLLRRSCFGCSCFGWSC